MTAAKIDPSRAAVSYGRVSTAEQATRGGSLKTQRRVADDYAHRVGLRIVERVDAAESASAGAREGFRRAADLCRTGSALHLVVEVVDRSTRNTSEQAILEDLIARHGVTVHDAVSGRTLSRESSAADWFFFGIQVEQAKYFSRQLGERTARGMQTRACAEGLFVNGRPPWPWVYPPGGDVIEPRSPDDATSLIAIMRRFVSEEIGLRKLAEYGATLGLKAESGGPVSATVLRSILRNRTHVGEVSHRGRWYPARHAPIVERELFDRVQERMRRRGRYVVRNPQVRGYTGFLRCTCGASVVFEQSRRGRGGDLFDYWMCSRRGCSHRSWLREGFVDEAMVSALAALQVPQETVDAALDRLRSPAGGDAIALRRRQIDRALAEIDRKVRRAAEMSLASSGSASRAAAALEAQVAALDLERDRLERERDALIGRDPTPASLSQARQTFDLARELPGLFRAATPAERHAILRCLLHVTGDDRSVLTAEARGRRPTGKTRGFERVYHATVAPAWRPYWLPFVRLGAVGGGSAPPCPSGPGSPSARTA